MCLAVPAKVLAFSDSVGVARIAVVDLQGSQLEVSLQMVPNANVGSWVLVHAGYAIQLLDADEARDTWEWLHVSGTVSAVPDEFVDEVSNDG